MSDEILQGHRHDAGFLQFDWTYYTDVSIDDAYKTFEAGAADGITTGEVMDLLRSTTDFDQISAREARQLYGALNHQWGNLSEDARTLANAIGDRLYQAYPPSYLPPVFVFRGVGNPPPLLDQHDENYADNFDWSNLAGADMNQFLGEMEGLTQELWQAKLRRLVESLAGAIRV